LSDDAGEAKGELEHLSVLMRREGLIMRILEHPHTPEPERVYTPGDTADLERLANTAVSIAAHAQDKALVALARVDALERALEAQAGHGFGPHSPGRCLNCGAEVIEVRPGKYQCSNDCHIQDKEQTHES